MKVITKEEFKMNIGKYLGLINEGAVFVYPTDTIYGIGCNALNEQSVLKIRELKDRSKAPFSVIAPSIEWIKDNCNVIPEAEEWLEKIPGPYTLVMELKNPNCVAKAVIQDINTLGIRQPEHWITKTFASLDIPIVTTSVNKTGKQFMTNVEDMDSEIKNGVDFIIDEGEKKAKPSNIVHLHSENMTIRDRSK